MKRTFLLKTMLLLCALVAGSSSMWADTEKSVTITFGTDNTDWKAHEANAATYTDSDNRVWSRTYSSNNAQSGQSGYSQFGNGSNTCTSLLITATAGSDMTVTAFSVKMAGASGGSSPTTGTIYLIKRTNSGSETQLASASVSGTSDVTCSISSSESFSSTDILKVSYVGTAKAIRVKELKYTYTTSGGGGSTTVATPKIEPGTNTYTTKQDVTLSCTTDGATIHYTMTEDGTTPADPTESDATYSSAISVTKNGTIIKAKAFKSEMTASSVATATYTIKPDAPSFNPESGSYLEGTEITLSSEGNSIRYNLLNGNDDPADPSATSGTVYTGPIALASGTNKIKVIAVDEYGNVSGVASRTFKGIAPAELPFEWEGGGKDDLLAITGVDGKSVPNDYTASDYGVYKVKLNTDGEYIQIFTNGQPGKVKIGAMNNGGTNNSSIKIQESPNGGEFTDVQTFEITGAQYTVNNIETTVAFKTTSRVVRILFVKPSNGSNVALGPITIAIPEPADPVVSGETISLTTTENMAGWRTFYDADQAYTVDEYTKIYVVKAKTATANVVELTALEATAIPAAAPVILKTSASNRTMVLTKADNADALGDNLLTVTDGTNDADGYRLGYREDTGVAFFQYQATKPAAGIVYIAATNVTTNVPGAPAYITIGGEATGVNDVQSKTEEARGEYFNLAGQRVDQPTKGLYIVNGRKVVVK